MKEESEEGRPGGGREGMGEERGGGEGREKEKGKERMKREKERIMI